MKPHQEIFSPEYWQQNAERLLYSANALMEKLRAIQDDKEMEGNVLIWSGNVRALLETNYMLLGYAAENSIKGYSIYRFTLTNEFSEKGDLEYLLKSVWKVKSGHDIISIANNSGLELSDAEKNVLKKLQQHALWKGRYHIQNAHQDIIESIVPGEKDTYSTRDREDVTNLIVRIGLEIRK